MLLIWQSLAGSESFPLQFAPLLRSHCLVKLGHSIAVFK